MVNFIIFLKFYKTPCHLGGGHDRYCMGVRFTTTYAISAYYHKKL